ncbi:hypothetical protein GB937_009597 [Aspergillus fischeri]|nr:hypothetical protein GB937_009597 [Aspergillus fischeri]
MTTSKNIRSLTPSVEHFDLGRRTVQSPDDDHAALVLEAWSQGLMTGSLVIMAAVTIANMRAGVLLHKLILLELILALAHGTFIFAPDPVYGWYLASSAIGLIISWSLHNVIAWMKNRPFMGRKLSLFYVGTIILAQPYWVTEIYANFAYFNNINLIVYEKIRPWEALFRDPWWIYTTCNLFWVVKKHYCFGIFELVRECPRFGLMLASMCLSIVFIVLDVLSVTGALQSAMPLGINPFWKLCFMFKCLCDTIVLDDFKTALDKLSSRWLARQGMGEIHILDFRDHPTFSDEPGARNNRDDVSLKDRAMTPGDAGVRWHAIHVGGDGQNAMVSGPSVLSVPSEGKSASTRNRNVFQLLLQGQIPQKFHFPNSRQSSPVTAGETPLGFPCMILQNGAFMKLLGLDTSLALYFEHTERGRQTVPAQPLQDGILMIDLDQASMYVSRALLSFCILVTQNLTRFSRHSLLDAFTEQIHTWYPILHAEYSHDFVHAVTSGFPSSVSSCMTLLVLAIGCVVECENGVDALQTRPDAAYIQAAMEMLPCVFSDGSPRSAQCLLLFAIYYLCHAQPCQAHDFVAMASSKLQTYIMNELDTGDDPASILGNCFYAAVLIESEIRVQLDLVDSGIWNITPFAPAPTASGTWRWHINQPYGSPASSSSGSEIYPRNTDMSYFVAEIAMRKMLQRCTWATSTLAPGRYVYAPIVAAELERQLDEWLQLLPETLSFRRALDIGYRPRQNLLSISPQGEFLRTQYYAFKASIYWPAVYEVLTTGEANGDLLCHCARFFSSYAEFAPSAALAVAAFKPASKSATSEIAVVTMGFLFKKPEDIAGSAWPAIVISGFVAFGGILFGYDTGTISGILAMPYWATTFSTGYRDSTGQLNVTSSQSSAIVSILSAGTFFGALGAAPMGDIIGRRWGLIASNGVFVLGVILQTIATSIPPFLAGRFFAGLGVGLISALAKVLTTAVRQVPLYQSETAPKWIRGFIVGSYQFAITVGLLLASLVNNATHHRNDSGSYRIPIAVQFAWSIILVVGMLILPETPRYLVKCDDTKAAARSLSKLRRLPEDHESIRQELSEIQANHQFEVSLGKSGYIDCFRGNLLKRLVTGCLLQALQQLTGINFIFYYGTQFFKNSGFKNEFVITLITNCVNVGSTIPGLYAIDKWGRRPVLLLGAVGMAVSQLLVAVLGTTTTGQDAQGNIIVHNDAAQKAAIAFICLYIFFFAASWGPIAWVVTGEIFPLKTRAKSLSMTTATNWLLNWALSFATPYLVNYGDGNANLQSKIFFIWFGCCFLCIGFVYFMIYETKGLTLEEVDELYFEVSSARRSVGWKPRGVIRGEERKEDIIGAGGLAGEIEIEEKRVVGEHREVGVGA